jgi:hypothetical protein
VTHLPTNLRKGLRGRQPHSGLVGGLWGLHNKEFRGGSNDGCGRFDKVMRCHRPLVVVGEDVGGAGAVGGPSARGHGIGALFEASRYIWRRAWEGLPDPLIAGWVGPEPSPRLMMADDLLIKCVCK